LPQDWANRKTGEYSGDENKNLQNLIERNSGKKMSLQDQRRQMRQEIDGLLNESIKLVSEDDNEVDEDELKK
jgi:hypothetical protein